MAAGNQEVGERPVREQLKKARIGNNSDETAPASETAAEGEPAEAADAQRLQKKRSFEDLEDAPAQDSAVAGGRHHTRKRSREGTIGEEDSNGNKRKVSGEKQRDEPAEPQTSSTNGVTKPTAEERPGTPDHAGDKRPEGAVEEMASPKIKRSRLHSTTAEGSVEDGAADSATPAATESSTKKLETKVPPTSGFANASAASPFSSLSENKVSSSAAPAQTSSSAFASSGLGAFSSSTTSAFNTVGKSSGGFGVGGGFGSGTKSPLGADAPKGDDKPAGSAFGGALGQQSGFAAAGNTSSGFGSGASSFGGKLGQSSGFGSGIGGTGFSSLGGSGGGLTNFSSGKNTPLSAATKAAKPFGAPADDEDEGDDVENGEDDESGVKSPLASEDDPQDERFYKQDIETGEENETTEITCRAKLYNWVTLAEGKKEWRERGLGVLRLNVTAPAAGQKPEARFLMRADGSHRVMLNTPVKKEIKFGGPQGEKPKNGNFFFMGTIDGKTSVEFLQMRVRQSYAEEMWERITELQKEM